jgi:PAS domain S-box-containing protein
MWINMNDSHSQQIAAMRQRVATLYRSAAATPHHHELLPVAFEELQSALEELQAMQEELHQQHEYLLNTRQYIEAEFQSYYDLFVCAPVAYLITGMSGTIRQANRAATELFSTVEKFMIGRSLALFVPEGERRAFRERLAQMRYSQQPQIWAARMQPWHGTPFQAELTTAVAHGPLGHPTAIRWIVQDRAARAPAEDQIHAGVADLEERANDTEQHGLWSP